mgnify:CR=1 FL=1
MNNPSTISSKSLTQSRYLPEGSGQSPFQNSRIKNSRWSKNITSAKDNYDFNMFSNYINSTFKTSSRNTPGSTINTNPISKPVTYESNYKPEVKRFQYLEKQVASNPYTGRMPTMVESKYMRSSSSNNHHPTTNSKINSNYLLTNHYNAPQKPLISGVKAYRVDHGMPSSVFIVSANVRFETGNSRAGPTWGTGGGLQHVITARVKKEKTNYTGGTRDGLVQSKHVYKN